MSAIWLAISTFFGGFSFRAWLIIGAVALFAIWSALVYRMGYELADTMWKQKALEAKIAKLELEIKLQAESDAEEDKLRSELEDENERLKKVTDAYLEELEKRPDKCLLGPDADRLQ